MLKIRLSSFLVLFLIDWSPAVPLHETLSEMNRTQGVTSLRYENIPEVINRAISRRSAGDFYECGRSYVRDGHLDRNRKQALFGEFPWLVAILKKVPDFQAGRHQLFYRCGGSLIHPKAVLTVAHCVYNFVNTAIMIRAGEWNASSTDEKYPYQNRNVEKIITYEWYTPDNYGNDIAILILKSPVNLADHIRVACLPKATDDFTNARCVSGGWGTNMSGPNGISQVVPKRVFLRVISTQTCNDYFRQYSDGYRAVSVKDTDFCALGLRNNEDTCSGDSGSPLVCAFIQDQSRYVQAGMVTWGWECSRPGVPAGYGSIPFYRDWIDRTMMENHLETWYYTY